MKKLMFIMLLVMTSCNMKEYRYEIRGKVYVPTSGPNPMHDAVWYTDTISFDGDTIYYFDRDGFEVRIYPPYILKDNSLNSKNIQ
jgi:hypothetical protein